MKDAHRLGRIWQTSSDGSMTANCKCGHRLGIYWLRRELATAYATHRKYVTDKESS